MFEKIKLDPLNQFYPDIEIYNQFENDKLVFFEANEVALLSIGFAAENKGKNYYYDKEIAPNLVDLLDRLMEDDTFYYDLIQLDFFGEQKSIPIL